MTTTITTGRAIFVPVLVAVLVGESRVPPNIIFSSDAFPTSPFDERRAMVGKVGKAQSRQRRDERIFTGGLMNTLIFIPTDAKPAA